METEWKNAKKMEENNRHQLDEDKTGEKVKMRKFYTHSLSSTFAAGRSYLRDETRELVI